MKYKHLILALGFIIFLSCSCSKDDDKTPGETPDISKKVTIQAGTVYQTFDGFAASDCWTANYVGSSWNLEARENIAALLFSKEISSGQPQGIGLSMWRFNLGGGTAEQGDNSGIEDKSRRAECFLQADGSLDWNKQQGQQYFLRKAKSYGCEQFVMFSNTPPVYYTQNGKGYSAMGGRSNLKTDCYELFAEYMANVASHFRQEGLPFAYISPVNEPQYNWSDPSQEGSGWQNSEIKTLAVALDQALTVKGEAAKILLAEAGDWEYLYKEKSDAGRSKVIENFFNSSSINYIGDLAHVPSIIGGHSYWTDGTWNTLYDVRTQVAAAASTRGLKVYQTEWSMLGDGYSDGYPGHDQASYMDIALYMSKVMHHDLTAANVSSWSYWTSMDVERWGHKNRFLLIKLVPQGGTYGDIAESGTFEATKTLWVLGNYSLFIRPGYQRVDLDIANPSNSFFGSAWSSADRDCLVVVYTNITSKSIEADMDLQGLSKNYSSVKRYITSRTKDLLEDTPASGQYIIDPQSVTTFVFR